MNKLRFVVIGEACAYESLPKCSGSLEDVLVDSMEYERDVGDSLLMLELVKLRYVVRHNTFNRNSVRVVCSMKAFLAVGKVVSGGKQLITYNAA